MAPPCSVGWPNATAASAPVVALENFYCTPATGREAALPPGTILVEGDVAAAATSARAFDRSASSRSAARGLSPGRAAERAIAVREPELTERTNLVGARLVLQAARERGAGVVFGGSFRVYGDELDGQTVDEQTPYGRVGDLSHLSKVYVEQLGADDRRAVRVGATRGDVRPVADHEDARRRS